MATTVSMPQLGESVAEGTIGRLLKAPGDRVERDEAIVEVMTDKVNAEIPSPVAGVVEQIVVQEGDVVPVGAALLVIGDGSGLAAQATAARPARRPPPARRVSAHGASRHRPARPWRPRSPRPPRRPPARAPARWSPTRRPPRRRAGHAVSDATAPRSGPRRSSGRWRASTGSTWARSAAAAWAAG